MIKKLGLSRKGIRKKIASLSLVSMLLNLMMVGTLMIPSENILLANENISVKASTIVNPECEEDHPNEWHFLINKIDEGKTKPASIVVEWSDSIPSILYLEDSNSVNAHYRTTENSDSTVTNATAMIYDGWNGQFNLSHGPCDALLEETGSITVCKIIIDENKNIVDGSENYGEFTISGIEIENHTTVPDSTDVLADTVFETTLVYNADLIGEDRVDDALCVLHDDLELGSYYYSEEIILGNNWKTPLYNDQFIRQVTMLDDFYQYSGELFNDNDSDDNNRDTNADGHIVLSSSRPNRTLVVLNEYKIPAEEVTIIASKIICDDEIDLPNWGAGGLDITETTAIDYVNNSNGKCSLAEGWSFQVGENKNDGKPVKYSGDFYGEATSEDGWITFGPTSSTGTTQTIIDLTEDTEQLRLREVLQEGYISFTYNDATGDNSNDVSAEFYCADDVYKYDNYDYIRDPQAGETYYCIGFNALTETPEPEKGHLIVQKTTLPADDPTIFNSG